MTATTPISVETLTPVAFKGAPVITTDLLAAVYGTDATNIRTNYSANQGRFQEGKHFFRVEGADLKALKNQVSHPDLVAKRSSHLILWTERGAARHAKMLNTDQAWDVFEKLEDAYFRQPEPQPLPQLPPPPTEPPFCTGCAARQWWDSPSYVDQTRHPLNSGPITWAELDVVGKFRQAVASAVALPPLPADISANLGDRVDAVIRTMADLVEFTRGTAADNDRLRRETEQFAAIKAILMGDK